MSAEALPCAVATRGLFRPLVEGMRRWASREPKCFLEDGCMGWMDSFRHILALPETAHLDRRCASVERDVPAWDDLRLEVRPLVEGEGFRMEPSTLAEGDLLELVLGTEGEELGRCLALRDGTFLCGPTGPDWVRTMLVEAMAEWRLEAA